MIITGYDTKLTEEDMRLPLYVATVGELRRQPEVYRPAGIADYQLLYTRSGSGRVKLGEAEHLLSSGDILILPPFTPHDYRPEPSGWQVCYITYSGLAADACFGFSTDIRRMPDADFSRHYRAIRREERSGDFCFASSAALYKLLLVLSRAESVIGNAYAPAPVGIKAAIAYVAEHYTETVELSRLAAIAGVSDGHFCRSFKEHTHMRPIEYVNHLRIESAKSKLISRRELTVNEISAELGFESPVYFSKVFRAAVGVTPTEYRRGEGF